MDFHTFIAQYAQANTAELALKAHLFPQIDIKKAIVQIQGRQKAKHKLPTWVANPSLIFPAALSVEQSSSEITAKFKAAWLAEQLKKQGHFCTQLADFTGGFGVDSFYFSQEFEKVVYTEQKAELAQIVAHNFKVLGANHIACVAKEMTIENLQSYENQAFNCIYLDPARRDKRQQKVFSLQDCEPNILALLPHLWAKTRFVLLKTSPMLDLKKAVKELACVQQILVLAVDNECKEVLYLLENKELTNYIPIHTINITSNRGVQKFTFTEETEQETVANFALPQQYLYEPNVAILKSGAFKSIAHHFSLHKLHTHTHLYTSTDLVADFAGRIFKILHVCKFDKKEILAYLPVNQANIAVRNFPFTVEEIRKKTGIKDGGQYYIFAVTDCENRKIVLITALAQFNLGSLG